MSWKGGLQTDVSWSQSNLYTLNTSATQLVQKNVDDLQVSVSYAKTGLKLPGLKKLDNNIRLTLTASTASDQTINRSVFTDLRADLEGVDRDDPDPILIQRFSLWPRLSYSISNQVTADVFVRYEATQPRGGTTSGTGDTSSLDGGRQLPHLVLELAVSGQRKTRLPGPRCGPDRLCRRGRKKPMF